MRPRLEKYINIPDHPRTTSKYTSTLPTALLSLALALALSLTFSVPWKPVSSPHRISHHPLDPSYHPSITMHFSRISAPLLGLLSLTSASPAHLQTRDLNSFINTERAISLQGVKDNIGPDGAKVPGAGAGFVVASPSRVDPPCEF